MAPAPSSAAEAGRTILAGLLVLVCLLADAALAPARADLSICNHTSYVAEAALGIEQSGVRATRGWFRLYPGQCRPVLRGEVAAEHLYLHARALPVYGTVVMTAQGPSLCAGTGDFLVSPADACTGEGQAKLPFAEVRPSGEGGDLALHLAEPGEYSDEQARLAALQRLLDLLGYDPGPIDGTSGGKTDTALAAYLGDRGLPDSAAAEPGLVERMLQAVRAGEGVGLIWCNDTARTVMAALAREDKGVILASGWWRIEPGRCLRPEQADGPGGRLYSFGAAVDARGAPVKTPDGRPLVWGGDNVLCTRANRFELRDHADCRGRGLDETGFAAVALSPRGAATVRFTP